jgi:hypothetical protein
VMLCSSSYAVSVGPAGARSATCGLELRLFHTGPRFLAERAKKDGYFERTQGTAVNVCHKCWLILIFNMSKTWRSMLRRVRGEEHLLLREYFPRGDCIDTAFLLTLFLNSPR